MLSNMLALESQDFRSPPSHPLCKTPQDCSVYSHTLKNPQEHLGLQSDRIKDSPSHSRYTVRQLVHGGVQPIRPLNALKNLAESRGRGARKEACCFH